MRHNIWIELKTYTEKNNVNFNGVLKREYILRYYSDEFDSVYIYFQIFLKVKWIEQ